MNSNKYYKDTIRKLVSYSDLDFDAIMTSIIEAIPVVTPEYNDISPTDFGMTILEGGGKMADVLAWRIDTVMNEALPGNARSRKAALIQANWLNYKPMMNLSSVANQKIVVTNDGNPIIVPRRTKFSTDAPMDSAIVFEADDTYRFEPPDGLPVGDEYEIFVEISSGRSVEEMIGYSNGQPNQKFKTTMTPYIEGSMIVEVLNPVTGAITVYEEAPYSFDMKRGENTFILRFDENGIGTITFGDGVLGNIPEEDSSIVVRYRIGGGEDSNLATNLITVLVDKFDNRVVSTTNVGDAMGGQNFETVASINANAGNVFKMQNRLVTVDDCENYGRSLPGVDDAYFAKDTDYIDLYYLYLLPSNRSQPGIPDAQKAEVKAEIDSLCMLGDDIQLKDPLYKNVTMTIEVIRDLLFAEIAVEAGVYNELKNLIEYKVLGETLSISDIYNALRNVDGVFKIRIDKLCQKGDDTIGDVDCLPNEVVRLESEDDITLIITE